MSFPMKRSHFTSLKEACLYQLVASNQTCSILDLNEDIQRYKDQDNKNQGIMIEGLLTILATFKFDTEHFSSSEHTQFYLEQFLVLMKAL